MMTVVTEDAVIGNVQNAGHIQRVIHVSTCTAKSSIWNL